MAGTLRHIINMANSIIGVSILSMPYCFKEAGLVLGIILILFSGFITKKTCMFLIKAAIMSRRRSYELLAFQVFGVTGKLLMEMCMILFLVGICISFHVVMGDLAPAIAAKYMIIENSPSLRCTILVGMVLLVILPLCLLRNIDSLASMSACSIGFYVFLNCIIFYMALPNLLDGSWFAKAKLFHFYSAFRVIPIMTLALSCQSNVFEIYDSIPDPDVIKMKSVVSQAVNICCALYIGVGFLGYVAFVDTDITGNVILKFPISNMTDCITIFFVFSLAISFPLMMFPCRTSIHSLIYKRNTQISYDIVGNYMPEIRFKGITIAVLISSLVLGILLPNIEYVLGLLGSTMGVTIALILPSVFYIKVYTKTSCDRLLAQGLLLLGIFIMVTGTYLHLNGLHSTETSVSRSPPVLPDLTKQLKGLPNSVKAVKEAAPEIPVNPVNDDTANSNVRKEPVVPEPPNVDAANIPNKIIEPVAHEKKVEPAIDRKIDDTQIEKQPEKVEKVKDLKPLQKEIKEEALRMENKKEEILHPDAIQKEEKEKVEENIGKDNIEQKQEEILKKMESQQKEQKMIIEEQKKILKELIDQKEKIEEVVGNPQIAKDKEEVKEEKKKNVEVQEKPQVEDKKMERSLDNIPPQGLNAKEKVDVQNQVFDNFKVVQEPRKIVEQDQQKIANNNVPNNNILQPHSLNIINDKVQAQPNINKVQAQPNVKKDLNIKLKDLGSEVKRSSIEENRLPNTKVKNPIKKVLRESNIVKKSIKVSDDDPSLKHDEERKKRDITYVKAINGKDKISNEENIIEINEDKNIANDAGNLRGPNLETKVDQDIKSDINGNDNQKLANKIDLDANKKQSLDDADNLVKEINHLSYDENVKLGDDNQQAVVQENKPNFDPLFESRHLLWLSRRTRRRKRRHEQFPEYWDEI